MLAMKQTMYLFVPNHVYAQGVYMHIVRFASPLLFHA